MRQETEQDAGSNDLKCAAGHDQSGTNGRGPGGKGKGGGDQEEDDELLAYPTDSGLTQGEHSVDKACTRGQQDQDEVGVTRYHADKGRGPYAQGHQDHGEKVGFVDVLLGAEADGEGAAGGDQGGSRVTEPDA